MSLRVVAGTLGGRRLVAPDGKATRPTTDRVREAVFNALTSLDAVSGARVLDLFAGSGALGIEALSRGAASLTLVDTDPVARAAIEANVASTGLASAATVIGIDGFEHLSRTNDEYDLVLLDPPYRFTEWSRLQQAVLACLAPGGLVVIESHEPVMPIDGVVVMREKRYGGTVVMFTQIPLGTAPHAGVPE